MLHPRSTLTRRKTSGKVQRESDAEPPTPEPELETSPEPYPQPQGVESGASISMKREFDAIYAANVLHFTEMAVAKGIVAGAGRMLTPDGRLFLYSPFSVDGKMAESNAAFDERIKKKNSEWGIKDTKDMDAFATESGLKLVERVEMPNNNYLLIYARAAAKCRRRLEEALYVHRDQEEWLDEWRESLECWWGALPLPTQSQVGGCIGALGLHLGRSPQPPPTPPP